MGWRARDAKSQHRENGSDGQYQERNKRIHVVVLYRIVFQGNIFIYARSPPIQPVFFILPPSHARSTPFDFSKWFNTLCVSSDITVTRAPPASLHLFAASAYVRESLK